MEYAANMIPASGCVSAGALPVWISGLPENPQTQNMSLQELEIAAIRKAQKLYGDDKKAIARHLGIGVSTLYRKLKQYEL